MKIELEQKKKNKGKKHDIITLENKNYINEKK